MDWKALVNVLTSVVLPIAFPVLAPVTPFILHGINLAEDMGGTGPEKLQKAIEIANSGVATVNQLHGSEIINVDAMNQTIATGISAVVNAANMIHKPIPQPFPIIK